MGVREQILIGDHSSTREGRLFLETGSIENYECVFADDDIRDCQTEQRDLALMDPLEIRCYGGCPQHLCKRCGSCKV